MHLLGLLLSSYLSAPSWPSVGLCLSLPDVPWYLLPLQLVSWSWRGTARLEEGLVPFVFLLFHLRFTLAVALCLSSSGWLTSSSLCAPRASLFCPLRAGQGSFLRGLTSSSESLPQAVRHQHQGTHAPQSGALLPVTMSSVAQMSSGLSQFSHLCLTHSSSDILCQNECSFCFSDRTFSTGSSFNWS